MLYDRVRVIVFDEQRPFTRGDNGPVDRIQEQIGSFGCRYAGWQCHSHGGANPTHLFMIDDPTEKNIADLLFFSLTSSEKHQMRFKIFREFIGAASVEYTVESLSLIVNRALLSSMLGEEKESIGAHAHHANSIIREMLMKID